VLNVELWGGREIRNSQFAIRNSKWAGGWNVIMTSKRYNVTMSTKRATIYLDADLHRALRLKAVAMDSSISEVVSDAVRRSFEEDASDLEAFDARRKEPSLDFEEVVRDLKRRGKL
jgi:hypothetical protein